MTKINNGHFCIGSIELPSYLLIIILIVGGESIPDNPLEEVNGVNGTGSLYSR